MKYLYEKTYGNDIRLKNILNLQDFFLFAGN